MPKVDIEALPIDTRTGYPPPFDRVVYGRERRRLGIAVGRDQFGVNLTTPRLGAASALRHWHEKEDEFVYVLEGEVVLVEDGGETVRCRGLQGGQRQRSSSSESSNIPTSICSPCATTKACVLPTRAAIHIAERPR